MINFSGPLFSTVDNRLMSLKLVQYGLTNAVMFSPKEEVLQPSEVLYKKAILVERGSFRPVTHNSVSCKLSAREPKQMRRSLPQRVYPNAMFRSIWNAY